MRKESRTNVVNTKVSWPTENIYKSLLINSDIMLLELKKHSLIKLEKLPVLEPPEDEKTVTFKFAEPDSISAPILQCKMSVLVTIQTKCYSRM